MGAKLSICRYCHEQARDEDEFENVCLQHAGPLADLGGRLPSPFGDLDPSNIQDDFLEMEIDDSTRTTFLDTLKRSQPWVRTAVNAKRVSSSTPLSSRHFFPCLTIFWMSNFLAPAKCPWE
jgi:hypothetical protein